MVVVDPVPLFRAGAVAALSGGGVLVLGEAAQLGPGLELARRFEARALLLGGPSAAEAATAVAALPAAAVVVLLNQPTRDELVEMLGTGVAGFALRSLSPQELVSTMDRVIAAGPGPVAPGGDEPAFVPLVVPPSTRAGPAAPGEPGLTPKELDILARLAAGAPNKRIADELYVTPATVKTHLAHIYAKLGVRNRHEAVSRALARGIVR